MAGLFRFSIVITALILAALVGLQIAKFGSAKWELLMSLELVASMVCLFIVINIGARIFLWLAWFRTKRQNFTWTVADDGIRVVCGSVNSLRHWASIESVQWLDVGVLMKAKEPNDAILLPKSCCPQGSWGDVCEMVKKYATSAN